MIGLTSYAEMERDQKNGVSHRGKATRAMIDHFLKKKSTEE